MSTFSYTLASIFILSIPLIACTDKTRSTTQADDKAPATLEAEATPSLQDDSKTSELSLTNDMQETTSDAPKLLTLTGRILYQEMEGGFFGFVADNGQKYTPIGMNKKDLRHGLVVQLKGEVLPNMITITQFGEVIKVEEIIILDDSKALQPGKPIANK